jgi:hypothetical protein
MGWVFFQETAKPIDEQRRGLAAVDTRKLDFDTGTPFFAIAVNRPGRSD